MDADKTLIIDCLSKMDDEAFSWLVMCITGDRQPQIWPGGTGGFKDRDTIEKCKQASASWIKNYSS